VRRRMWRKLIRVVSSGGEWHDIDDLYRAVAFAETGRSTPLGGKARFIRTRASGESSAYGPVQITYSFAKLFSEERNRGVIPAVVSEYYEAFLSQGKSFLASKDSDLLYGLGASGVLADDSEDIRNYEIMAKAMMGRVWENSRGSLMEFIKRWRGATVAEDFRYYKVIVDELGRISL